MIDHNVMRLDITVHNSLAVTEIEGLQELEDVESDINIVELGVQASEIGVVDMLKDERRCLALSTAAISWSPRKSGEKTKDQPESHEQRQAGQRRWVHQPDSAES